MLPPNIVEDESVNAEVPPKAKALLEQQHAMIDQLTQHLNATMDELDHKKLELASRERIELYKSRAQIIIKLAELESNRGIEELNKELTIVESAIQQLNAEQTLMAENAGNGASQAAMPQTSLASMPPPPVSASPNQASVPSPSNNQLRGSLNE
jgi:prefoldin subunit 5